MESKTKREAVGRPVELIGKTGLVMKDISMKNVGRIATVNTVGRTV